MPFAQYSSRTKWGTSSAPTQENEYDFERIERQIENARRRIEDAGYAREDADRRNWFERLTNLPEGQNVFFDTMELLSRPGRAVINVLDKAPQGENIATAAWRGLSGRDRVSGADLADRLGVENRFGRAALGFGLDVALDPLTYVPGGVLLRGARGATGIAAAPIRAGYQALESAAPSLRSFRETRVTPAIESTKDALGYMFNPDYRKTETLFGEQSDFLKNLERETENTRRYMQENAIRNIIDTARQTGIEAGRDVGRIMEAPLRQLDEAGNVIERPIRELSTDPQIQQAAENLTRSNQILRQYALDNGIDIKEMEGYMTHVWSQAERELQKQRRSFAVDRGRFGIGSPNQRILRERKLKGSVEDINEMIGREYFEPNAYFATAIGQQRLIDYIQAVQFRRQVLSNPDFAIKYVEGMEIPRNAVVIDTNNYKFIKESGDILEGLGLADEIGGKYVVTKAAKQALDRFQRINTEEGIKAFMKAYNAVQNTWKKFALFSPGYHIRNFVGNMWNSYAAGMNPAQLTKYTSEAIREVNNALRGKESELFNEFRRQGLLMSGLTRVEFGPGGSIERSLERTVEQASKTGLAKVGDRLRRPFQTSRELGETADMVNRFAMYKWARDKGMDPKQAAEKVREALFDYMDLTPFEQNVMRSLFPFYTWSRKNIPFQIRLFMEHPERFQRMNYIRLEAQEAVGLDEETTPDYMKENFYLPMFGREGRGKMLGLNLPLGDIPKATDPLKLGSDLLTPLIKTPIELAANYNLFRQRPIQEFEGQAKQLQIPFTDTDINIPIRLAYALEQATGQVGRGVSSFLQRPENVDQDSRFRTPSLGISSFVKDFDAERYSYLERLDELRKLQDLIRYIEQQEGVRPRTISEINRGR